jgi:hypothetical protein
MRRFATTFLLLFLLALFLPLCLPSSHSNAPPQHASIMRTPIMRVAPVVVNAILPTLSAQTRDTLDTTGGAQSRSIEAAPDTVSTTTVTRKPSSHVIMWSVVFGVIVLCVIGYLAWRGDAPEEDELPREG